MGALSVRIVSCRDHVTPETRRCSECNMSDVDIARGECGLRDQSFAYASVDVETTGLDPETCQIIQIGVVLDDFKRPIDMLPKLELLVLQEDGLYVGEPFALHMNCELFKQMIEPEEGTYCTEKQLPGLLETWFCNNGWDGKTEVTYAGKNFSNFDWHFLEKAFVFHAVPPKHRCIDLGNLYWDPKIDGGKLPNTLTCMERAGILGEVTHKALEDAVLVVKGIRKRFSIPL